MDRVINYTGQLLPASSLLQIAKDSMIGLSKVAEAIFGASTQIYGFAVTPTSPASMQVSVAPGVIFSLQATDATAYGDLGTDSHQIVKQGVLSDSTLLTLTAPGTAGQSINYLVQVAFSESDTTSTVLPYYNSVNPSVPYTGPGNSGTSQATRRQDLAIVALKAGAAATTGSQTTPSPDAGYVGAYVITVAYGATTVVAGNISKYASAPFVSQVSQIWAQIAAVATAAGLTPDPTNASQLKSALDDMYLPALESVSATVASGALTLGLAATTLSFRSPTLTSGAPSSRTSAAISLVVPSGATLGTVSGYSSRLCIIAIDNAGTVELAVANLAGGLNLDETTLISTTAISAAATSASVIYSTASRSNVAFRVVGFIDITEASAGTWSTAPSLVQGSGGQALSAMSGYGLGQTEQDVTASRALSTTYYNTTGRPIEVTVYAISTSTVNQLNGFVNGSQKSWFGVAISGTTVTSTFMVRPGSSYQFTATNYNIVKWTEVR